MRYTTHLTLHAPPHTRTTSPTHTVLRTLHTHIQHTQHHPQRHLPYRPVDMRLGASGRRSEDQQQTRTDAEELERGGTLDPAPTTRHGQALQLEVVGARGGQRRLG